jgi:succinate dehydrogenase / fumarate reductase flavoprotein subunit
VVAEATGPLERADGENPYDLQHDLQVTMQNLVGIIRTESELTSALDELDKLEERCATMKVSGPRTYNPGWNLATDLPAMLTVSRLVTKGAIARRESRGGHTRDDYPLPDPEFGKVNLVQRIRPGGEYTLDPEPLPEMPDELRALFEEESH